MNDIKPITLLDRLRNAVRAFKGNKIGELHYGVTVKRCDQCKRDADIRDKLIAVAGARAAYMDSMNKINIPGDLMGENRMARYVISIVDNYLNQSPNTNFDAYIEALIEREFGLKGEPL